MTVASGRDHLAREEAALVLAHAIGEARTGKVRLGKRTRIVGFHGEDFEQRWPRVEHIVNTHNRHVACIAWDNALRAGWTAAELNAAGLVLKEGER